MSLYPPRRRSQRRLTAVEETSAGGVVIDVRDGAAYIALIARFNRAGRLEWCLPKGHVEPGETLVETAVREVAEETGILGRALITLGTIDYWFSTPNHRIHKMVHHYLLEALGGEITVEGDPDHEAVEARWFRLERVHEQLTFPNERRIAQMAWLRLAGTA
ncbi:NUDIX hydrolase [Luteipulveratus sp. YIM 133132]|uniref:NUDIX hydrolase n=1 Tax=Luteipulveratus flavus TaxID=3031728 RepID=A0ABT6C4Y7_9MICO|nr:MULTISPECIES: NUDIX hydrolase [unclassified Luteipulveratus]MDE9365363.1 NUDIX hydrolase [Luteipulveratus sp. YIM 133132]MDF8263865.1 NUDIX hydrolase [Luteipulveratus sp. YIM 133296]